MNRLLLHAHAAKVARFIIMCVIGDGFELFQKNNFFELLRGRF